MLCIAVFLCRLLTGITWGQSLDQVGRLNFVVWSTECYVHVDQVGNWILLKYVALNVTYCQAGWKNSQSDQKQANLANQIFNDEKSKLIGLNPNPTLFLPILPRFSLSSPTDQTHLGNRFYFLSSRESNFRGWAWEARWLVGEGSTVSYQSQNQGTYVGKLDLSIWRG